MRLSQHPKPIPNVFPPYEYVQKYLVTDPCGSGHIFWRDSRANHTHSRDGQALLKWAVKPTSKTHGVSNGVYSVVRLLLQQPETPLKDVVNICGLPQCVNPAHWSPRVRVSMYGYARLAGVWGVVSMRTGRPIPEPLVLRARTLDGVVHVVRVEPSALHPALCGAPIDPATSVIVESLVTCRAGC